MSLVFLVEDDDDARILLTRALSEEHEVKPFEDAESALQALVEEGPPQVLVSDLELPGLGGEDLARVARSMTPRPRVVLMSGNLRRLARAATLAQVIVAKPCRLADLKAAIGGGPACGVES